MNTQTTHILLIEDNPGDVRLIAELLKDINNFPFELHSEKRLSAGLDYLAKGITDVVLLDLSLPDSQGYDTFAKTIACAPQIPIVILSVLIDDTLAIKAVQTGAQDYLIKGQVNGDMLTRTIRYAIERKKQEQALRESEYFLNSIIENIPDMIFVKDAQELRFVRFNKAGEELLGFSKSDMYGKNDYDFFPSVEAEHFIKKDKETLNKKQLIDISEEIILTKEKGERILHTKKIPILDEKGIPKYLLGISEDITERKQAEQVLAESEIKFKWLFEYAPIAYHILTPDGIITDVNRRWCQVLDYSRKEVLGKEIFDFIVEEERKEARASFIEKKSDKQTFLEGSERNYLTKAGMVRTFKIHDFLVVDQSQNITSIQTTLEDITERKQMETALRDSEAELQALFASMQDLVIIYNKEGRYLQIATTDSQLLIKPPDDLLGKTNHEIFPKEEADRFLRHITTVLESQRTLHIEYSLEIDHHKVWFDASVSPMNMDKVIWVARDITERKMREEETHFTGIHDALTKLYNRTFFEEELSRLEKSRLYPVSIFMIDVDELKTINDTHGHAAGDEMLRRISRVLLESFRSEDMVARIGGDEFVVILPRTNEEDAHLALKRIHHFMELNNKNNDHSDLKISVGIATCDKQGSLSNAVKQADDRMYLDKRSKG